jgi:hypothetical protein
MLKFVNNYKPAKILSIFIIVMVSFFCIKVFLFTAEKNNINQENKKTKSINSFFLNNYKKEKLKKINKEVKIEKIKNLENFLKVNEQVIKKVNEMNWERYIAEEGVMEFEKLVEMGIKDSSYFEHNFKSKHRLVYYDYKENKERYFVSFDIGLHLGTENFTWNNNCIGFNEIGKMGKIYDYRYCDINKFFRYKEYQDIFRYDFISVEYVENIKGYKIYLTAVLNKKNEKKLIKY